MVATKRDETWMEKLQRWSGELASIRGEMEEQESAIRDAGSGEADEQEERLAGIRAEVEAAEGSVDDWLEEAKGAEGLEEEEEEDASADDASEG